MIIEFGCGPSKRDPEAIGVDSLPYPGVDVVEDAFVFLAQFANSSVKRISSHHFIEHLDDPVKYISECSRVLVPSGRFITSAPHWSNSYFYSDPTHRSFWGLYSMCYFADSDLKRKVPAYHNRSFRLLDVRLGFRSDSSFPVRNGLKRALNLVNQSRWMQEFYEENLASLVGCYEVTYVLERL